MEALKQLYNGILNDYSIQRYTMGWKDVVEAIEKRYRKPIPKSDIQFENKLIYNALNECKGSLASKIETFAREMQINLQTLSEKEKKGTQRSPFGIGS